MSEPNPLIQIFDTHDGRLLDKWAHNVDAYHGYLARFRGQACTIGGWRPPRGLAADVERVLRPKARIIGVDIACKTEQFAEDGVESVIGDQGNRQFLRQLAEKSGPIDVLINDGGHKMQQQIATLVELFNSVKEDGVILVEDTHTSDWRSHGGTFTEFCKGKIDDLNAWHSRDGESFSPSRFTREVRSMHFYDSIVIFEKGPHPRPKNLRAGTPVFDLPEGWEKFGQ